MIEEYCLETEKILGKNLRRLSSKAFENTVQSALNYWRLKGFPYEKITKPELYKEYKKMEATDLSKLLVGKRIISSTTGLRLANSFHPQMWNIRSQGHSVSPIEHFNNDETLIKLLKRAVKFWPSRHCWSAYCVRNLFRIYSGGRVSNFRPTVSKLLIETYSNEGAAILDFCSGFGGRLLGALCLNRHYVGIDASPRQIIGSNKMYKALKPFVKGSAEFFNECAEDLMTEMKSNSFDLIFTSPPYYNTEKYCNSHAQSYRRYLKYDDWRKMFLKQVIGESRRLLKKNGFFIVNIADVCKYSIAKDFERLSSKHFNIFNKLFLDLHARPVQKSMGNSYKLEPIYILQAK